MKIDKGKIYAVVGENGCGKTTFFNQLFKKYHNKKIIHIQQNDLLIKDLNIKSHLELVHYNFNNDELNQLLDLDRIKKLYTQMKVMKKLSRRTQIECLLILYCPVLFNLVYRVYGRISGVNKKYEVK